jgi:hypothetical protein
LIFLHADRERNVLVLEEFEPFLSDELSVRQEHPDCRCIEAREKTLHQGDALPRGAVARVVQKGPHERSAVALGHYGQDENIDVGLADFPVRAIEAQVPSIRVADQGHHNADAPVLRQRHLEICPKVGDGRHQAAA